MKKTVWLTFFIALILVNGGAWLVERYSGFYIEMMFRLALVLGITVITSVFVGAMLLVNVMEQEQPLTGPRPAKKPEPEQRP